MTARQLETSVKDQFNMGLYEFIKDKVEVENLYDYELAGILDVDVPLIGRLRKAFGMKKATEFPRQFERTYGAGAVDTFKQIIENPNNTLADVARHFGFSREYARQVYQKAYGCPYTKVFRKKLLVGKRKRLEAKMKSRRIEPLMSVREKLRSAGFIPRITNNGSAFAILVNGYNLAVRCTSKSVLVGRKLYFRISKGIGPNADHDFFICLCRNNGKSIHYVIPQHVMPKCGVSLLPEAEPGESKYARFKEAWHLLTCKNQKKEVS